MKPSNRGKKAPTSIDFIGKREEEGTSSPSSMDGALAWRDVKQGARGMVDTVLNILQDIKPRQRHANRPWIEPLHPPPCQLSSSLRRATALAPRAAYREFNASSIIGNSSSRRLFHRFPPFFPPPNCSTPSTPLFSRVQAIIQLLLLFIQLFFLTDP